jgi:chromosome segregation ATPase
MVSKILLLIFIFTNILFASFEYVSVGNIDRYYNSKISTEQLKSLLLEIEEDLESQLQTNIFDLSNNGKPINLVYVEPSLLEKRIERKIDLLKSKQKKINQLQEYLTKNQKIINKEKELFKKENALLNSRIKDFNSYVKEINKKRNFSNEQFKRIKADILSTKKKLDIEINKMNRYRDDIKRKVNKFNTKVNSFNNQIREYKRLSKEIETLTRGFKKVKGMTFGVKEINTKTYFKDGKRVQEKTQKQRMDKIEIYGFSSRGELKAVLAHEILHLVGLPHINDKYSLMNSVMQENQIKNLKLTKEDIKNFRKNF